MNKTKNEKIEIFLGWLEMTDMLIDQVVYRLHGLTEGEIRVVKDAT